MNEAYKLTSNITYFRNRNCVILSSIVQNDDLPSEILPDEISVHDMSFNPFNRSLTTELILNFSYRCNLNCIYCSNDSGSELKNDIKTDYSLCSDAVKFVIKNALVLRAIKKDTSTKPARVIFSGGGEPTVEWGHIEGVVNEINSYKARYGKSIAELWILTNAQMTDEKMDYILESFDHVAVSCDGFSVQDIQRPVKDGKSSRERVKALLQKAEQLKKNISIRMTVTGLGIKTLYNDASELLSKYCCIANVIIEPFGQIGRGLDDSVPGLDYDEFISIFDKLSRKYYGKVYNSASLLEKIPGYPCRRLAGISLVVSPYGEIVCCDVVSPVSELWEQMKIAEYDGRDIHIKKDYRQEYYADCMGCIAWKFCYGGCPMQLKRYKSNGMLSGQGIGYCKYIKKMITQELIRRVELSRKSTFKNIGDVRYRIYSLREGI